VNEPLDYLGLAGKTILITGVANRKSIAFHVARLLISSRANVVLSVRSQERKSQVQKLFPEHPILVCDLERQEDIQQVARDLQDNNTVLHGLLHAVAFADYESVVKPFHETSRDQFLRAMDVSCFSLVALANALRDRLDADASVVATSISTTKMASENYGFMGPVKAALDSSLAFLVKSFSSFSRVRFNAIAPSLLKTSASAGIPGYVDSYLFAEQVIPRKKALQTEEAANVAAFLLSPRSSGINAQSIVVDAGMSINYFDQDIVRRTLRT
jgi:enoyl-[acyl-carrier protein] reductase I